MSDNFGFGCACGCWANALATRPTLNAIATADALVRDNVILRMVDYSLRRRAGTRPPGRWKNDCWMRIGRPLHAMVLRMSIRYGLWYLPVLSKPTASAMKIGCTRAGLVSQRPVRWLPTQVRPWMEPITLNAVRILRIDAGRSEEHTSELQSLMRISYAV